VRTSELEKGRGGLGLGGVFYWICIIITLKRGWW